MKDGKFSLSNQLRGTVLLEENTSAACDTSVKIAFLVVVLTLSPRLNVS